MADELVDPDMAQALMEAVRRSGPGMGAMRQQDALAEAYEGVGRTPLPPEYGDPEHLRFLGGYGVPFENVRSALNRNPQGFTERPSAPFGYQDTGSDIRGTVAEQIMSMMPPQEPLPGRTAGPPPSHPYNTEFSDLVGMPPARGYVSSPPPRASALPSYRTEHLPPPELYSHWDERPDPRLERISSRGGAYDWQPSGNVSAPSAAPDPERAARVEQLMRELEEQRALEARLRALGR
jgi:hypothetical protein